MILKILRIKNKIMLQGCKNQLALAFHFYSVKLILTFQKTLGLIFAFFLCDCSDANAAAAAAQPVRRQRV